MRKVVLYQLTSLGGVAEEPGNWMFGADQTMYANLATVAQSMIAAGLVDELRLVVSPALADGGREGLNAIAGTQRWELLDSATTSDGQLLLGYHLADRT